MNRTIYVKNDAIYDKAQEKAKMLGISLSSVIEAAILEFVYEDALSTLELAQKVEQLTIKLRKSVETLFQEVEF